MSVAGLRARGSRIRIVWILPLLAAAHVALACTPGLPEHERIPLTADRTAALIVQPATAGPTLLEEMGADLEYRRHPEAAFLAIDAGPSRLGFALVEPGAALDLRSVPGSGEGALRVTRCLAQGRVAFLQAMAWLYTELLGRGEIRARWALWASELALHLHAAPTERAWLHQARANALYQAGRSADAARAFARAANDWRRAGEPVREAVAHMAAGEDASRAGRFAQARSRLQRAATMFADEGIAHFALRSEAALCTLLSRQAKYPESIACEQNVIARMRASGIWSEIAVRHISIGNQWMRLGDIARARENLNAARALETHLRPLGAARLATAWGNLLQREGELASAALAFEQASAALGASGVPSEQANVDIRLARLARLAGASGEEHALLRRAVERLDGRQLPVPMSVALIRLAEMEVERGEYASATQRLHAARSLCALLNNPDCLAQLLDIEFSLLLSTGETDAAQAVLTELATLGSPNADANLTLHEAALLLHTGEPARALARLAVLSAAKLPIDRRITLARIEASARLALGQQAPARKRLIEELGRIVDDALSLPSAAMRVSARSHIGRIQSALNQHLIEAARDEALDPASADDLLLAFELGSLARLFAGGASGVLSEAERTMLSRVMSEGTPLDPRAAFVALSTSASPDGGTLPRSIGGTGRRRPVLDPGQVLVTPIAGERDFAVLAWRGSALRVCLRWPRARHQQLAHAFAHALETGDADLAELDAAAHELAASLRRCHPDTEPAQRWSVLSQPATIGLPWAWIASYGGDDHEPLVESVFRVPGAELARSSSASEWTVQDLHLIDLNLEGESRLAFAAREFDVLQELREGTGGLQRVSGRGHSARQLIDLFAGAPLVHVVGHANPSRRGQLYQGIWYEGAQGPRLLTWAEIAASRLDNRLIVLSACGSGPQSEGALAADIQLGEAFLAAGVQHVVSASNALSDAAAPLWASAFHRALLQSGDPAVAARAARQALRQTRHFRHPRYWAGIQALRRD